MRLDCFYLHCNIQNVLSGAEISLCELLMVIKLRRIKPYSYNQSESSEI